MIYRKQTFILKDFYCCSSSEISTKSQELLVPLNSAASLRELSVKLCFIKYICSIIWSYNLELLIYHCYYFSLMPEFQSSNRSRACRLYWFWENFFLPRKPQTFPQRGPKPNNQVEVFVENKQSESGIKWWESVPRITKWAGLIVLVTKVCRFSGTK